MNLLEPIIKSAPFAALCETLEKREARAGLFGLQSVHCALYAAALAQGRGGPLISVCETDAEAVRLSEDIAALGVTAAAFPARDFVFLDVEGVSHDIELARLAVLGRVCGGEFETGGVVCCSLESFCQCTLPRTRYDALSIKIKKNARLNAHKLAAELVAAGYTRGDRVEGRGQFAIRGGIIDVFPAHSDRPLRIELFGDEVEALSFFDSETQRRAEKIKEAVITPAREAVIGQTDIAALEALARRCEGKADALRDVTQRDLERLAAGVTPACTDRYLRTVYEKPGSLPDYLPEAPVFYCGAVSLGQHHQNLMWRHTEDLLSLEQQGLYLKSQGVYYLETLFPPGHAHILAEPFARSSSGTLDTLITVRAGLTPRWNGEFSALAEDLRGYLATGYACVVLAGTPRAALALCSDLEQAGFTAVLLGETLPAPGMVGVAVGTLSSGFELPDQKLCVIAGRRDKAAGKAPARKAKKTTGKALGGLEELKPGDYVVHQNHGIGVFDGIHRIDHYGLVRDYIKIRYNGEDTLYIPVTQLDLVSQYISPKGEGTVKLARLHSGEWNKTRQAVYRSVREMAKELIALYAKREQSEGIRFSADNDWQREFEQRFAYEETDDQLKAAADIKKDMERTRPMDRLLCGDVGVGKTEVALRAIFKCVIDGYQCAVLVPTTILAWQHYHTFLERLEPYPIKVAMLSRFSTAKEIKEAMAGIKNGTVDVAVGTHRLLQKDVAFKKLGLVVVDEEQRFGVAHKEKLKQTFADVDVLTLSATPIPRTLNMAMSGIRDMSVIEEPPQDRHPVQTYVLEYDEQIILDAIKRELARGGQVYYLHNRVETIERAAARLKELLPDAAIETAHGQMNEESLSGVWQRLIDGECDILVCTTIIETGVDVPNCNTLVVENADHMGLAQLYQLRGRVGRSGRRAFAYFTFRRDRVITDVAAKRLAAIRDFTSFGSGFKIAMRDLQIRGAGSVLSARQSGHMAAVGYDTYLRILQQAVSDETGAREGEYRPPAECSVDLAVSAYIPESYIADNESRIEMYKRVAAIQTREDAADALEELTDRFGAPPACVKTLVSVSLARAWAGALGFYEISAKRGETYVTLYGDGLDTRRAEAYIRRRIRRVLLSPKGRPYIAAELKQGDNPAEVALEALEAYADGRLDSAAKQ